METQSTQNGQSNLEKENQDFLGLEEPGALISYYTTNQNRMVLEQK